MNIPGRSLLVGAALLLAGVMSAEVLLRLYFREAEVDRSYFGLHTFIGDEELNYRHSPNHSTDIARPWVFAPHTAQINAVGFRDQRLPSDARDAQPRVLVGGASFLFGIGIDDEEALIHRHFERLLRRSHPQAAVFNTGQTGYMSAEICTLVARVVPEFAPDLVVLTLRPVALRRFAAGSLDVVDGYRLPADRPLKTAWADYLRTHSFLIKRCANSPALDVKSWVTEQLAWRQLRRLLPPAPKPRRAPPQIPAELLQLRSELDARGIPLHIIVLYYQRQANEAFSELLASEGFAVTNLRSRPEWEIPGDGHWHPAGARAATEILFDRLPPQLLRDLPGAAP